MQFTSSNIIARDNAMQALADLLNINSPFALYAIAVATAAIAAAFLAKKLF